MANVMATLIHEFGWIRGVVMAQDRISQTELLQRTAAQAEYPRLAALQQPLGTEIFRQGQSVH